MFCTHCGETLPAQASACPRCRRPSAPGVAAVAAAADVTGFGGSEESAPTFASGDAATFLAPADPGPMRSDMPVRAGAGRAAAPARGSIASATPPPAVFGGPLAPGAQFGSRYHIIRLLGMGGMGAVYQAWDDSLGVAVALKVVRPEITADPDAARDLERRFKRELLLARQVTHKNVVRIHDLGEIDGIKYLTMPYIQGSDLASVLSREGRLPVPRALAIMRQVVAGLQAAHEAGVVHRDLKPANIMIDADDQAVIMDFGIARSVSGGNATMAGAVVGTLEYMAPEQAMAHPVDHRADIYAAGLILYDMVLGSRQASRAESAVAELMTRVQKSLPPARSLDPTIPDALERIMDRCTQPDPSGRYQTTGQLASDLALIDAGGRQSSSTGALSAPAVTRPQEPVAVPAGGISLAVWLAIAATLVVALGAGAWVLWGRAPSIDRAASPAAAKPVALAVIPFRNASSDPALDWLGPSLADMIAADVGQSERLRLVSAERVSQLLRDLRIGPNTEVDSATVANLADFSSADRVLVGRFVKLDQQIRIEAVLHGGGSDPVPVTVTAAGEADVLRAAQSLAAAVHKSLSLNESDVRQLQARAFRPSSQSVQALRYYSEGMQFSGVGEHLEAAKRFEESTKADPQFALAFSRLAQSLSRQGRVPEAEQASSKAIALSAKLPVEERELIAGTHARVLNDLDKAIESFGRLVAGRPNDVQLRFELATMLEDKGLFDRARDEYAKVLELEPKHLPALLAAGRVAIRSSDAQGSLEFLTVAHGIAVKLNNREASANTLQALGIAYSDLGRPDDALRQFQESLAIKKEIGDRRGIAASLTQIAQIQEKQGKTADAWASYKESIAIREEIGDRRGVGIALINLGASYLDASRYDEALDVFKQALQSYREIGDEDRQARILHNIGTVHFARAEYDESRTYFEQSLALREKAKVPDDLALTLTSLGDVSIRLGEYDRAQRQYLQALELWRGAGLKRGVAIGSFGMGTLLDQQGRYGAALEAKTEALKIFDELKERTYSYADILIGHGTSLTLVGGFDQALGSLDKGLALARELNNQSLIAQALNAQGENALYRGDLKRARASFEQAVQTAARAENRYFNLVGRLNLAKVAAEEGRGTAAADLKKLIAEADTRGLKQVSAEGSLYVGVALLKARNTAGARSELSSALTKAERLGARSIMARAHFLLAEAERLAGNQAAAAPHQEQATQILDEMQKEARTDSLLRRSDLSAIVKRAPAD